MFQTNRLTFMTRHSLRQDPVALTAVRHIQDFGFIGWHLRKRKRDIVSGDTIVDGKVLLERQVVEAGLLAVEEFPERDDGTVFLMMGPPRPEAGDGLVALTRYWLVDEVATLYPGRQEAIYAVLCVSH